MKLKTPGREGGGREGGGREEGGRREGGGSEEGGRREGGGRGSRKSTLCKGIVIIMNYHGMSPTTVTWLSCRDFLLIEWEDNEYGRKTDIKH